MRGVLSNRAHIVEVKCDVFAQDQGVPNDGMLNVTTECRWVPVQRDGPRALRVSLIRESHYGRSVACGDTRGSVAVSGLIGIQSRACSKVERGLNFSSIAEVVFKLHSIPIPPPGHSACDLIGFHR